MQNDYLDFKIHIDYKTENGYPLSVQSPAGEERVWLNLPFVGTQLYSELVNLNLEHSIYARQFGQKLFDALLIGNVRSLYYESRRLAEHQQQGLRIKLMILPPDLVVVPWEYLYDVRSAEFVCLSRNTPLVRYLELAQPIRNLTVTPPLHILGLTVSPIGLPQLDLIGEKQRIEQALSGLQDRVTLTWLVGQNWQALQQAMRQGPWHVLHFIGHGGFDIDANEGVILLADEEGKAQPLPAMHLGRLLGDHESLRLVVLNACEGATSDQEDIFSSTAATLMRRGIPSVLAMQYAISDHAAIEFSHAFYGALADGSPVDAAVTDARKAMSLALPDSSEWGTPILHMRASDGRILELNQPTEKEARVNIDVSQIAQDVLALLMPHLATIESAGTHKKYDARVETAIQLLHAIQDRFAQEKDDYATQVLERFKQQPEKRKAGFQEEFEEILKQDSEFAQLTAQILNRSQMSDSEPTFSTQVFGGQVDNITNIQTVTGGITFNKGSR